MTEFQYCYWLMGVFELGGIKTFHESQIHLVKEHLHLVEERKYNFCTWLEGFLDGYEGGTLSEDKTKKILDSLRKEFFHVIDRSYPSQIWKNLQEAHEGRSNVLC